jgi:hypothetical protein
MGSTSAASDGFQAVPVLWRRTVSGICWEGTAHPCEHHYVILQTSDTRLSIHEGNCSNGDGSSLLCVSGDDGFCGAQSLVSLKRWKGSILHYSSWVWQKFWQLYPESDGVVATLAAAMDS